jgi:hypothetical protein
MNTFTLVVGADSAAPLYLSSVRIEDGAVRALCFGQRDTALEFKSADVARFTAGIVDIFITEHLTITVREES